MPPRDPNFDAYVLKIHQVLDRLDYYRLLGVDQKADVPTVKNAFHQITGKFHPDKNRDASAEIKKALYDIFKRLNEAYRILVDHEKRKEYDEGLSEGKVRLEQSGRKTVGPKKPEDSIKSIEARKFYRQAADELDKGNFMNADLHVKVALSRESGSKAIKALFEAIQQAKAEAKQKKKKKKEK
jgi:DnaJ-class molecular chaperone